MGCDSLPEGGHPNEKDRHAPERAWAVSESVCRASKSMARQERSSDQEKIEEEQTWYVRGESMSKMMGIDAKGPRYI